MANQGLDIFDLALDRVRLGVATVAPAPAVIAVDGEMLREKPGEFRLGAGRTGAHGSVYQHQSWAIALLIERNRGAIF